MLNDIDKTDLELQPAERRKVRGPLVINWGKSNLSDVEIVDGLICDIEVDGGIRVLGTDELGFRNVGARAARGEEANFGKQFHGFHWQDSRHCWAEGCDAWYNGVVNANGSRHGHGFHTRGDTDGLVLRRCRAWSNVEDGFQTHPTTNGSILVTDFEAWDNSENSIDLKGAALVRFDGGTIRDGMHEAVLLHRNHVASEFYDMLVIVEGSKAILNLSTGKALFDSCRFQVPHDGWWNLDGGPRYGPLLDGQLLDLTCVDCSRV